MAVKTRTGATNAPAAQPRRRPAVRAGGPVATLAAALAAMLALGVAAPPAAAIDDWLPNLIPQSQEAQIGAQQHQQVVAEYGGAYEDERLQAYVEAIGQRLAAAAGASGQAFTYTVLDSPIVNAFALPGGYIYVTRGLLALANNEAELAAVLAHEMGHVLARHGTQRMSRGVFAELGTAILGQVLDSQIATSLARTGAGLWMSGYSREQEREADSLGLQYMRAAGYPPIASGAFLGTMGQLEDLQRKLGGSSGGEFALLSSHPQNPERVQRAVAQAGGNSPEAWQGPLGFGRSVYLDHIDGMVYGESRRHGFIRDNTFLHPEMRFAFSAPAGWQIVNTPQAVIVNGPDGSKGVFDADLRRPAAAGGDPAAYIRDVWTGGTPVQGLERIEIGGLPAATAVANVRGSAGAQTIRLVAIRAGDGFYRFQFGAPASRAGALDPQFRQIAGSFRQLSAAEAERLQPLRLVVQPVREGDSSASFAARSALEEPKLERWRVLNGLREGEEIAPGQEVKTVL